MTFVAMPSFSYFTISTPSEGQHKEKGSKFLAFAFPVVSDFEIKEQLIALRKKYFDARHHCYGRILGPDKEFFKAFDDGEPRHSAGDPILGQLRSKHLTNVLGVVVRDKIRDSDRFVEKVKLHQAMGNKITTEELL